jgi:hypothetical protein
MVTFVNDDNNNAPLYYIAVTLSANDGNGFQQLVNWNPSSYSSYLNTDCQNHNWQDGAGNLLYSWFETPSATSSSTSVYEWVVLPNGTTTTIYLVFTGTSTSGYSTTHTGVQPSYSGTYAQYDNGTSVFTKYWNFAGTSLPSDLSVLGSPTYTVDNGLTMNGGSGWTGIYYDGSSYFSTSNYTNILDMYLEVATGYPNNGRAYQGFSDISSENYQMCYVAISNTATWKNHDSSGTTAIDISPAPTFNAYHVATFAAQSGQMNYSMDYNTFQSSSADYDAFNNAYYIVTMVYAASVTLYTQWQRIRIMPTSNSMPTTTFGSVTPISNVATYGIYFSLVA